MQFCNNTLNKGKQHDPTMVWNRWANGVSNMSLWLDATVTLNPKHLDPNRKPTDGLKKVFKKYGKDFDEPHAEAGMTQVGEKINIHICNPDGYVDCIHNAFKHMVEHCPYVHSIVIDHHYYF